MGRSVAGRDLQVESAHEGSLFLTYKMIQKQIDLQDIKSIFSLFQYVYFGGVTTYLYRQ